MAAFLTVPLKKSSEVDLVQPLKNIIASIFSTADNPEDYTNALNELNKLRSNATCRIIDIHESSLEILYRYYDQLVALETKLPLTENQIPFKWKDAFDKGTLFGGRLSLTIASLSYEKVCILFNIAALQSQIVANQNLDSDDGLKLAAKLLQQACGIFTYLKENILVQIPQDPTPDLCPDTLSALAGLMLAQAQEAFFFKAANDKMKDSIIAKVAAQCEDLYAEALKQLQRDSLRHLWDKEWISTVAGKQAAFHAMAEYHQSIVAKNSKAIGEELARLQHAEELIKAAQTRASSYFAFKEYAGKISRAYEAAKKDNDFIYHERIPDVKTLPPIGRASLAKSINLSSPLSLNFNDLFSKLVPVPIHQALAAYETRKAEIVNMEIGKLREQTQLINGTLSSLNLPAALEDMSGHTLPQSVKVKALAIVDKGGIQSIDSLLMELPELLKRNKEILDESNRLLDEEKTSDEQMRTQFKERWTRIDSDKLTQPLRSEVAKYQTILNNAITADKIIKEKYAEHKNGIILLSKSEDELNSAIPFANPSTGLQNSSSAQELRSLMEEVESIKAERDAIESEFKNVMGGDMKTKFLQALAQDGVINEQDISTYELQSLYGSLQQQVKESIGKQEQILANVQRANNEFCKEKVSNQSASQRENMLREIASAHDAYMELSAHLQEGTKFYNDLTELLLKFQNKVSDFCFARRTEKDELLKDIQQNIVNQPTRPAPKPPVVNTAPVSGTQTSSATPPARPPPPVPTPRTSKTITEPSVPAYAAANAPPSGFPSAAGSAQPGPVPVGANMAPTQATAPHGEQGANPSSGYPYYNPYSNPYPVYPPQYAMPQPTVGYGAYGQPYPPAPTNYPPPPSYPQSAYPQQNHPYPGAAQQYPQWR